MPVVEDDPPRICCETCARHTPFARLPLYCLSGPSGAGKSTVARLVGPQLAHLVVTVEQDVLWQPALAHEPGGIGRFRSTWLRMAAMIGQSGRPVLLCGTVAPVELDERPERVLFSDVHHLALGCHPDVLAERLRRRPAWRGWDEARISEMVDHARGLAAHAAAAVPPLTVLDTTTTPVATTADHVRCWVEAAESVRRTNSVQR